MTPAARYGAAIAVLDRITAGERAEAALSGWSRANRYAGSKDRAAIRDHVFDVLRRRASAAALGGGTTGRQLILGLLRARGEAPEDVFSGIGYAPSALEPAERVVPAPPHPPVSLDCPEWLWPRFEAAYGTRTADMLGLMQSRAPVFLRVNLARSARDKAVRALASEGIVAVAHPLSDTALQVTAGARQIQRATAYQEGLVELQDAASQAVVDALPLAPGQRVLDYCAGGGGKSLAMAARIGSPVHAHDIAPARMRDLPERARRAGTAIRFIEPARIGAEAAFDLVLCDAPCSGSGSWRRDPEGKWALTPEKLERYIDTQRDILARASGLVAPGGMLAYATCSLLPAENGDQIDHFLRDQAADRTRAQDDSWQVIEARQFTPLEGGDGFYVAVLRKPELQP